MHRFNKAQQDGLLPRVEDGTVTLIGATTENPSFALNGALLSRAQVMLVERLSPEALEALLQRVEAHTGASLPLDGEARPRQVAAEAEAGRAEGAGRSLPGAAARAAPRPRIPPRRAQ